MIDNAILNFPNLKTKIGNIKNPMIYDKYTFSHILCTGFTLYHIKDKLSFFRNVYLLDNQRCNLLAVVLPVTSGR